MSTTTESLSEVILALARSLTPAVIVCRASRSACLLSQVCRQLLQLAVQLLAELQTTAPSQLARSQWLCLAAQATSGGRSLTR